MTDYSKDLTKLIHEGHVLLTEEETQQAVLALLRRVERGASKQPTPGEQPSVSKSVTHSTFWHDVPNGAIKMKMDIDWEGRLIMNVRFDTQGIDLASNNRDTNPDVSNPPGTNPINTEVSDE